MQAPHKLAILGPVSLHEIGQFPRKLCEDVKPLQTNSLYRFVKTKRYQLSYDLRVRKAPANRRELERETSLELATLSLGS